MPVEVGDLVTAELLGLALNLPDEEEAHIANTVSVTATSFATLPSPGPLALTFDNPSDDYDLLVDLEFSAWVGGATTSASVGISASGSLSWSANSFGSGGPAANSDNIFISATTVLQSKSGYPVRIPAAGSVTFTMHAFRTGGASASCNYPIIRVKPRHYIVP